MKTLYIDCGMGAAGDMLTAALLELLPEPDAFVEKLNGLGIPGVQFVKQTTMKCGIRGTHVSVKINGDEEECYDCGYENDDLQDYHAHSHENDYLQDCHNYSHENDYLQDCYNHSHESDCLQKHHGHAHLPDNGDYHSHGHSHHIRPNDIEQIVKNKLSLPKKVQGDILAVYNLIAEAESRVHGVPVTEIHFHEVGTMDAIADITAVCLLMDYLSPAEVVVSPIHVGNGQVRCAHGILPVPAPATAEILKDIPIYSGTVQGELCTPTGAALLKHFATKFGNMPVMKTQAIGYGMGKKDFQAANCVRAFIGETEDNTDTVLELSCNVDDMTAEAIGFALEKILEEGALDVYTMPIGMKKSRPGTLLRVMCKEADRQKMLELLFKHTTTLGIREARTQRYILDRKITTVETPYGTVHRKESGGYGVSRAKYEYEDIARIARERGMSVAEVLGGIDTGF